MKKRYSQLYALPATATTRYCFARRFSGFLHYYHGEAADAIDCYARRFAACRHIDARRLPPLASFRRRFHELLFRIIIIVQRFSLRLMPL
jgi:hypothetical protein